MCMTNSCSCKGANDYCSRLCKCRSCKNTPDPQVECRTEQNAQLLSSSDESSSDSDTNDFSEPEELPEL